MSTTTLQGREKEPDVTRMEVDSTRDNEEVPRGVMPKINFTLTSSKEKSLDEWFLSDDRPAGEGADKTENDPVAKNTITSSSKNLPSLPATSIAGLHQPSVQDVGNSKEKKGLRYSSTTAAADHAQPGPSGVAPSSSSSMGLASNQEEEKRVGVPLRGNDDSDSDSSVVSGIELFVDKSPDREILD